VIKMAKYRGRVDGKLRGKYTFRRLGAEFDDASYRARWDPNVPSKSPQADMDRYFIKVGEHIHSCSHRTSWYEYPDVTPTRSTDIYHMAGSTIKTILDIGRASLIPLEKGIKVKLEVEIHSNSDTSDIVDKLIKRFPYLREEQGDE